MDKVVNVRGRARQRPEKARKAALTDAYQEAVRRGGAGAGQDVFKARKVQGKERSRPGKARRAAFTDAHHEFVGRGSAGAGQGVSKARKVQGKESARQGKFTARTGKEGCADRCLF